MNRRATIHCQGDCEHKRRHSVGQLYRFYVQVYTTVHMGKTYRVQVPADLGRVIPEIASMSDDLPALCWPMTAICGMSMSTWTLHWSISKKKSKL